MFPGTKHVLWSDGVTGDVEGLRRCKIEALVRQLNKTGWNSNGFSTSQGECVSADMVG